MEISDVTTQKLSATIAPWALPREDIPLHVYFDKQVKFSKIIIKLPESFEIKDKRGRFALHTIGVLGWIISRYLVAKLFNQSFGAKFSRSYMHLDTSIMSILASSEAFLSSFREKGEGREQAAKYLGF